MKVLGSWWAEGTTLLGTHVALLGACRAISSSAEPSKVRVFHRKELTPSQCEVFKKKTSSVLRHVLGCQVFYKSHFLPELEQTGSSSVWQVKRHVSQRFVDVCIFVIVPLARS